MKDLTGREARSWSAVTLPTGQLEISALLDGTNSVVFVIDGNMTAFDLPPGKLVDTMAAAAVHLREHFPALVEVADQLDREVEAARRDQQRLGVE